MRKITWIEEMDIEKKYKVNYYKRRYEYYLSLLEKMKDIEPEKGDEYITKVTDAEEDMHRSSFNALYEKVRLMTGKDEDEIIKIPPDEIYSIYTNAMATTSDYIDDGTLVQFIEVMEKYAESKKDDELLKFIRNEADKILSNKKK